jgi:hypothetical protein
MRLPPRLSLSSVVPIRTKKSETDMELIGQGKPLPANCPFKGERLSEDLLFLYEPDANDTDKYGTPNFKRGFAFMMVAASASTQRPSQKA